MTTQHERDSETGFDYRGARFYDAEVGRFLSVDPLAVDYPSFSDYSYVAGNPVIFIDPTGRSVEAAFENEEEQSRANKLEKEDKEMLEQDSRKKLPRVAQIQFQVYKKVLKPTIIPNWSWLKGIPFTKPEWKAVGSLTVKVLVREITNEKGITTTEISDVITHSTKTYGKFQANVSLTPGELKTNNGSTRQDIALNYGISEEGSGGFTFTAGLAKSIGIEGSSSTSSYSHVNRGTIISIESDHLNTVISEMGNDMNHLGWNRSIITSNGKYMMKVNITQFMETLKGE